MASSLAAPAPTILFGERLAASATFDALFRDGMSLVEDTATYLDGEGKDHSQLLPRIAALAYASESMRLTTRLMQIASWLLLQRAVNAGEMSFDEAAGDKVRTRMGWEAVPSVSRDEAVLPTSLLALIKASHDLQVRIQRLDAVMGEPAVASEGHGPLVAQRAMLRQAFAT